MSKIKNIHEIMQIVNPDSDAAFWEDNQVRKVAELYHAQFTQPTIEQEGKSVEGLFEVAQKYADKEYKYNRDDETEIITHHAILQSAELDFIAGYNAALDSYASQSGKLPSDNAFMNGGNTDSEKKYFAMGYKAGKLQGGGEAIEFLKWVRDNRYVWDFDKGKYIAAWDNYSEHTEIELYQLYLNSLNK